MPPLTGDKVPVTPVASGRPVAFVRVTEDGVPSAGVTSVGLFDKTTDPVPVEDVTPVPPFATGKVPVTPLANGSPVALVSVPEDGVPRAPLNVTGAPVLPMLFWSALETPVPRLPIDVTGTVVEAVITPVPLPYT